MTDDADKENPFVTKPKPLRAPSHVDDDGDGDGAAELAASTASPAGRRAAKRVPLSPFHGQSASPSKPEPSKPKAHAAALPPHTPRHRDAARKVPVTPTRRILLAGVPRTPRSLRTPSTPRHDALTAYHDARQLFARGAPPTALFGRDHQRHELSALVSARIPSTKSGCIYVSGPPGTGKSALVADVCRQTESESRVKAVCINCMSVKHARDLYRKLLDAFAHVDDVPEGGESDALRALFLQRDHAYLVTLDEVDRLVHVDTHLLYNLFEWSMQPSSSLVLISIANALDFTDRFLPRLKARGLQPHLLPFMPYTAPQIATIVTSKLDALLAPGSRPAADYVPFIHPTAIQFLSKKVAAHSGDLRKAFDICARAIDVVQAETHSQHAKKAAEPSPSPTPSPSKTALVENMNLSSSPARRTPVKPRFKDALAASLAQVSPMNAPRVTIAHMARITATIFGNGAVQRLQNLNIQQKAVLCALAALEQKERSSTSDGIVATPSKKHSAAPTIKFLLETYTALCKRDKVLHPLTSTEFRDVVSSLETLSLISSVEGKTGSLGVASATPSKKGRGGFGVAAVEERRVSSAVGNKELAAALVGPGCGILQSILDGHEAC